MTYIYIYYVSFVDNMHIHIIVYIYYTHTTYCHTDNAQIAVQLRQLLGRAGQQQSEPIIVEPAVAYQARPPAEEIPLGTRDFLHGW